MKNCKTNLVPARRDVFNLQIKTHWLADIVLHQTTVYGVLFFTIYFHFRSDNLLNNEKSQNMQVNNSD